MIRSARNVVRGSRSLCTRQRSVVDLGYCRSSFARLLVAIVMSVRSYSMYVTIVFTVNHIVFIPGQGLCNYILFLLG